MAHACIDGDDNCRYATGQRDDVEDDLRDGELGRQSAAHCGLVLDVWVLGGNCDENVKKRRKNGDKDEKLAGNRLGALVSCCGVAITAANKKLELIRD